MPKTFEFQPLSGAPAWRVTFEGEDMIGIENPPADNWKNLSKADMKMMPARWWDRGFFNSCSITEVTDGQQETQKDDDEFEVVKLDLDKRLVFGWAYVTHDEEGNVLVDKSGEYVDDPEELERAAYDFVIKSRMAGDMHQRLAKDEPVQVGTMVESMVLTPEKAAKMGIPPGTVKTGWWVGFRIENDDVWKAVKNGERPAFSIHGKARKEPT